MVTKVSVGLYDSPPAALSGEVRMWTTATPPSGWLNCDDSGVSRITYATLYAVIGTTFGAGDGSTTFNLPDFRGRGPIGVGTGDASDATAWVLAEMKGSETHVLVDSELPTTTIRSPAHASSPAHSDAVPLPVADDVNTSFGGDGAHNNLQPSLAIYFIIKT